MIRSLMIIYLMGAGINYSSAQDAVIYVECTADTLSKGDRFKIRYTIENASGQFEPPSFSDLSVLGGPNMSSQYSMINGAVTQRSSYEYFLEATDEGDVYIDPALFIAGDSTLSSPALRIFITDNPTSEYHTFNTYELRETNVIVPDKVMSAQDSLRIKLRNVKTRKI
jgi:hypothetical protein